MVIPFLLWYLGDFCVIVAFLFCPIQRLLTHLREPLPPSYPDFLQSAIDESLKLVTLLLIDAKTPAERLASFLELRTQDSSVFNFTLSFLHFRLFRLQARTLPSKTPTVPTTIMSIPLQHTGSSTPLLFPACGFGTWQSAPGEVGNVRTAR